MIKYKNNSGFSVILAIVMTGFMIVLTTGVFLLVLAENRDTKSMEYHFKSLEGAEGSLELAMLKSKQFNYSYDEKLDSSHPISRVLFENQSNFNKNKDVLITYNLSSIASEIKEKKIEIGNFDIIPLFSYGNDGVYKKVKNITITGLNSDVIWNIVGDTSGMSGTGNFINTTEGNFKTIGGIHGNEILFAEKSIQSFLHGSEKNYLIIHNLSSSEVTYTLTSLNNGEFLTKDKSSIISSGEIGGYKQNLSITVDSSKYLNLLKYSIFSN